MLFRPGELIALAQRDRIGPALGRLILLAILAGTILAGLQFPSLRSEMRAWSTWLDEQMPNLTVADGKLAWQPTTPLPYSRHFRGWRVDFADHDAPDFQAATHVRLGPEPRGLWISPARIVHWERLETGNTVARPLLEAGRLMNALALTGKPVDENGDGAETTTRLAFDGSLLTIVTLTIFALVGVASIVGILAEALFYVGLFAIIPTLLRSPLATGGLARAFVFNLQLSLVPVVVGTVYGAVGLPWLDFKTAFLVAFLVYLLVVVVAVRRQSPPPPPKEIDW